MSAKFEEPLVRPACDELGQQEEEATTGAQYYKISVADDGEKCYLPKAMKQYSAPGKPMTPVGYWATGKVSFDANRGFTGVRPVVDCYSITKTNINEWRLRFQDILDSASHAYKRSEENGQKADVAIKDLVDLVEKTQKDTTASLVASVDKIKNMKDHLADVIKLMQDEISEMERKQVLLKKSLVVFGTPESIAGECMNLRLSRPDRELLRDDVEKQLVREKALIHEIRLELKDTLYEFEQQQIANRAARERLELDWSDKTISYEIDGICAELNNNSKTIMYSPGSMRASPDQPSGEYWKFYSQVTLDDCERTREQSIQKRSNLLQLLKDSLLQLRKQADLVERELDLRIQCLEEAIERLVTELKVCLNNLAETENRITNIKVAIGSFATAMKVAQTRMKLRHSRERVENCRDVAQMQLIDEVRINQDGVAGLYQYLDEAENCKVELEIMRGRLEREIMLKRRSVFQDRDRCKALRKYYPTEEMMLQLIE